MILALDPGSARTAYVFLDERTGAVADKDRVENVQMRRLLRRWGRGGARPGYDVLAIEMIQSFGMPVGREVFATCVWSGRFVECANAPVLWPVFRTQVKGHLCGKRHRPNDAGVRAALVERYGDPGPRCSRGELAGFNNTDLRSALAVACYVSDKIRSGGAAPAEPVFADAPGESADKRET